MPSYVTAKKNAAFICYVSLVRQANTKVFQANPTLAAGDVKVSIDGGAENNIAALPVVTPAGSKRVKVALSTDEMNGDNIQVTFSDTAGNEWCDLTLSIQTTARQIDDLTYPTVSGRSIDVAAGGEVAVDLDNINQATAPTTLTNITVPDVIHAREAEKLLTADRHVDTSVTPWAFVLIEQGTGGLSVGVELVRQELTDVNDADITNTTTVIGHMVTS